MHPPSRNSTTAALTAPVPLAIIAGLGGLLASYGLANATFLGTAVGTLLAHILPGELLTTAIVTIGDLAHILHLAVTLGITLGLLATGAWLGISVARDHDAPRLGIALAAFLDWALTAGLTGEGIAALPVGATAGIIIGAGEVARPHPPSHDGVNQQRRRIATTLAGIVALGGVGAVHTHIQAAATQSREGGATTLPGATPADETIIDDHLTDAAAKSLAIDGIEPLVSEHFYEVDINPVNPRLDASSWSLATTGEVDRDIDIDYAALTALPAEHRFVTLRCVGESLNGHKMDNALWTGIPIATLLEDLALSSACECVMLRAADGYYEEFPLSALEGGFLAYGMNGRPLPRAHGYPVRALIPGHWGEINVKWLTEIEFLARETDGYWEERGWHGTGPVTTVAKLHAVNHLENRIQVGGHAYAGIRGIDRVEVSTNGGTTWQPAELSEPLPGEDVWRQWKHEYHPPSRAHDVVVRAIDGEGNRQPEQAGGPFPRGATGWVTQTVEPTQ